MIATTRTLTAYEMETVYNRAVARFRNLNGRNPPTLAALVVWLQVDADSMERGIDELGQIARAGLRAIHVEGGAGI